jgi:membrane-associated phospholipid phosphatase
MPRLRIAAFILIVLVLLLPLAALFDARVSTWAHEHHTHERFHKRGWVLKWPGDARYSTIPLALLVGFFSRHRWRGAALIALTAVIGGFFYLLLKWFVGRTRPFPTHGPVETPFTFHPFNHGWIGFFKAENQAFPSGHACLAFGMATAMGLLYPRWRWAFYLVALLTAVERVLENVHYPSDVVAGACVGVVAAILSNLLLSKRRGAAA